MPTAGAGAADGSGARPAAHVPSYWLDTAGPEPEGLTGLAAAYRLAATHGLDALVLEAHRIGWGASGRNGGFVGLGRGKLGLRERIRAWGLETARRSVLIGVEAVETVRELIDRERIACDPQPQGWLLVAHRPHAVPELEERVRLHREVLGHPDTWVEARMAEKWPVLASVGSEYFWHGHVCLSYDLMPHVQALDDDPSVAYAMAYLGSGVAMATYCGGLVADPVAGKAVARDSPLTAGGLRRFPLPALRTAI